jgi:site-specific DNA-cytosine methylase
MIKVGSDFSGVGAFNQALMRLGVEYKEIFACDMDKFARQTFIHNYGEPEYYPTNVYEREIPPRECFRLMDFPDSFTWPVSDSQAYKQAGNSIVVNVLYKILKNLLIT